MQLTYKVFRVSVIEWSIQQVVEAFHSANTHHQCHYLVLGV